MRVNMQKHDYQYTLKENLCKATKLIYQISDFLLGQRQTDGQTQRQTDRQTHRHTDIHTDRQTGGRINGHIPGFKLSRHYLARRRRGEPRISAYLKRSP